MAKFVFVLSAGLENSSKPTRCMQFAQIAKEDGHDVTIFLIDEGVIFGKKGMAQNIAAVTGDEMSTYLEFLTDEMVPILVCTPCARARQIGEDDLIENASLSTGPVLIKLCAEGKVFNF